MPDNTPQPRLSIKWLCLALLVAIALGFVIADYLKSSPESTEKSFVGRAACVDCHQKETDLFHGSHHDLAMDLATDETVLASFDDAELEHFGITSKFFRDGQRFMVNTEGPDGEMQDFEVKYVFGVEPLQQYMVETKRSDSASSDEIGQVQVLRLSWDTQNKKWFYLPPPDVDYKLEPSDPLHWTGITQRWNTSCAVCHSTNLERNFDSITGHYRTKFSEIDVSCEACHGPGSLHVELAENRKIFWDREHGFGLAKLKGGSNVPQVESCAPCHSRRSEICSGQVAGNRFDDFHALQLLSSPVYFDDGQIRDEDYVYGSFIQSKMYHNGIRCTDCHDPHSTKLKFDDNRLCTSCHQHSAGKYDSPNHHHHEAGTEGASCVACHMPETTYMELDARRDHSLRVPRPDLSVKFGTPNACTGCHLKVSKSADNLAELNRSKIKQYSDWFNLRDIGTEEVDAVLKQVDQQMLDAVEKWYPAGSNDTPKSEYYAQLAEGKSGEGKAAEILLELALDRKSPGIFRASALETLRDDGDEASLETAIEALGDPDPKVITASFLRIETEIGRLLDRSQYGAARSETIAPVEKLTQKVAALTVHASRLVRIEAARLLTSVPRSIRTGCIGPQERSAYDRCVAELRESLQLENDRASSHMQLSWLFEAGGNMDRAKRAIKTAIQVEPELSGPRVNLAVMLESEARDASQSLQQSASAVGDLRKEMARIKGLAEEAKQLRAENHRLLAIDVKRAEGLPVTHGLDYSFAMSCYLQRDLEQAEKYMLKAYRQQTDNSTYVLALATFYQQQADFDNAAKFVQKLIKLEPKNPGFRRLADEILGVMEK